MFNYIDICHKTIRKPRFQFVMFSHNLHGFSFLFENQPSTNYC